MNLVKFITIIFLCFLVILVGEVIYFGHQNAEMPERIKTEGKHNRSRITFEYQQKLRKLEQQYNEKKQLATGVTVYDRIYNTQDQSLIELIQRLSLEALPKSWSFDVKVEEFTHFILLIYLPHNSKRLAPKKIAPYLEPILQYCGWLLKDVAVFDKTHKCYLFFDSATLKKIKRKKKFSKRLEAHIKKQGEAFTQFNSVTIECKKYKSHLFLPIEVSGSGGVVTCYSLLDTGASITTLSSEVIAKTGFDNLQKATRRSFNTANGVMSCPIAMRSVNVGGVRKDIEVAVNQKDDINLLGVNFFNGVDYIVDFQNSAVYIWEK